MRCPTLGIHRVTGKGFRAWMPLSRPVELAGIPWSCREQGANARVLGVLNGALPRKESTTATKASWKVLHASASAGQ